MGVTGSGNWTNYTNPELDKLIDAQSEEFDEAKRIEIVQEAQRMILPEHGPQITLTGGISYSARWKYVHLGPVGERPGNDPSPEPLRARSAPTCGRRRRYGVVSRGRPAELT